MTQRRYLPARLLGVLATLLLALSWPLARPADANVGCTRVVTGNVTWPTGTTVPTGETWCLDSANNTTVASGGNVVVLGTLRMRPQSANVVHTLRFTGAVESQFVGGGMSPVASDDGLWVMDAGVLDISGTPKTAWCRCSDDPTWRTGDELRVAPTRSGDFSTFAPFVRGSVVPEVAGRRAEVLNLTRNVNIEGLATGRAHIFIRSSAPQTIRYASIRHMGPRNSTGFVLGRYGLHFHHSGNGSRGSMVEGVVVRDTGSHSFVPHGSHGVTFRNTIAYNVIEDAYWWDPCPRQGPCPEATHDTLFDGAVAALVRTVGTNHMLSGFRLEEGSGNAIRNSVGVGVQGGSNASAFHWPESANQGDANVWAFTDNVAHNNLHHAMFVWQNDPNNHVITGLQSYRNGEAVADHGAYSNSYIFENITSYQDGSLSCGSICPQAALQVHAASNARGRDGRLAFRNFTIDGAGVTRNAVTFESHNGDAVNAAELRSFNVRGFTGTAIRINEGSASKPGRYDLACWTVDGRDITRTDFTVLRMHSSSVYRVQRRNGTAFQITPTGSVSIAPFTTC